jgi:hypothetical protein
MNAVIHVANALLVATAFCGAAAAQTAPDRRGFVGVKAGLNHERAEDALRGTSGGGGIIAGLSFGPRWAGEVEFWLPGHIHDATGEPAHRDILFSVGVVRSFETGRVRPFLLAGLTAARTETSVTFCSAAGEPTTLVDCSGPDAGERISERFTTSSGYFLIGGGLDVPLGPRLRLVPDLRVHLAVTSVIVRPAIGVVFLF